MNPVSVEVEHLELVMQAGQEQSLRREAWRTNDWNAGLLDDYQIVRVSLILQYVLQTLDLCIQILVTRFCGRCHRLPRRQAGI